MPTFLEDVRQLTEQGDIHSALELIDLWLDEYPADVEAHLLKAAICLAGKQNYVYVGQLLVDFADDRAEPLEKLRRRSAELAWSLVAKGRDRLRGRYPSEALDCFDDAMTLLPTDPVIPLAAGLALARLAPIRDAEAAFSPFGASQRRFEPAIGVEKYLRRVIERAPPQERPYEVAAAALIREWLVQDRLTPEAFSLLAAIAEPNPSTREPRAELNRRVMALAQDILANLLRCYAPEKADELLQVCRRRKVASARLSLYAAESLVDEPERALAVYKQALARAARTPPPIHAEAVRTLLAAVEEIVIRCPHCAKATRPDAAACAFCDSPLLQRRVLIDDYPDVPDAALAHVGMAEMLLKLDRPDQAAEHARAALHLLPAGHPALEALRALQRRAGCSASAGEAPPDSPALKALRLLAESGGGAELLLHVRRINDSGGWLELPLAQRTRLIRRLIAAGQVKAAQETLVTAFADRPGRKSAAQVQALLDAAIAEQVESALHDIERLIAAGQPESALALASNSLNLRPDARLYLARGRARLDLGDDLAALEDFLDAATRARDAERRAARKAAALVLERRWNISGAQALLDLLDPADPDVLRLRARMDRRERGEPVVLTERVSESVMDDTLTRRRRIMTAILRCSCGKSASLATTVYNGWSAPAPNSCRCWAGCATCWAGRFSRCGRSAARTARFPNAAA